MSTEPQTPNPSSNKEPTPPASQHASGNGLVTHITTLVNATTVAASLKFLGCGGVVQVLG